MEDIAECLHVTGKSLEHPRAGTVSSKQRAAVLLDITTGEEAIRLWLTKQGKADGPLAQSMPQQMSPVRVCDTVSTQHSTATGHTGGKTVSMKQSGFMLNSSK